MERPRSRNCCSRRRRSERPCIRIRSNGWRVSHDPTELCTGSRLSGNTQDSSVLLCSSRKGYAEEGGTPFFARNGASQGVGSHHEFASAGANARRLADSPRIPEGWLVHGKSRLGHNYRTVRRQDLLESFSFRP